MFDIRKMQENVIDDSVKAESNAETADEVAYGKKRLANAETNHDWVKSTMCRLENQFRVCSCPYA